MRAAPQAGRVHRHPAAAGLAAVVLASAGLAGCAGSSSLVPAGTARDRITASDESDTSRRARVRLELASAYFGRNDLPTALDEVKQSIQADPTSSAAFNLRGLIYAGLGDDALAQDSFRRALQLDPRDADVMHNYAWYLCQQKRFQDAEPLFTRALDEPTYRGVARTLLAQGVCQARAGQLAEAERTLGRALQLEPANHAVAVNLSEVLYRRGDYERARFHIRRVNALPDVASAQTLWLAARIEVKGGSRSAVEAAGAQLRGRFPNSREAAAFDRGQFDD